MSVIAAVHAAVPLTGQSRLAAGFMALVFIVFILELIRRHKLQERYTVLWLLTGVGLVLLTAFPQLLGLPAQLLGVRTPQIAWFALAFIGIVLIIMHLTVTVSRQGEQITRLAQELGIERAQRKERENRG